MALALKWREEQQPNQSWAQRYGGDYALVENFLNASETEEQKRAAEKEAQREAELKRLQKQLAFVLIGFLMVAGLSLWAVFERTRADEQAKQANASEQVAKQAKQKATHGLFDSTVTHASLLTKIEDFAEARKKLKSIRKYDADVDASRVHARDLLAGFADIMGGEAQATFTDANGQRLPPLVGGAAISPDGRWLAAAGERGTIALFERATGKLVQKLKGHDEAAGSQQGSVRSIVFHPEQPWLFSAGDDGRIILWSLPQAGQDAQILQQWIVDASAGALAVEPDGKVLASGHVDGMIRLWQLDLLQPPFVNLGENGEPQSWWQLEGHTEAISQFGLTFSPDGQYLASASDGTARVWDWQDEQANPNILRGHSNKVLSVVFSPDGQWLASSSSDHGIILWDMQIWQPVRTFKGHQNMVFGLQFIDDRLLASASFDKTIRLWDVPTGVTRRILQGHTTGVQSLVVLGAQGRKLLYSTGNDGTVKRWSGDLPEQWLVDLIEELKSTTISPNGNIIAVGFGNGSLKIYSLISDELNLPLLYENKEAHESAIKRLTYNSSGTRLVTAT